MRLFLMGVLILSGTDGAPFPQPADSPATVQSYDESGAPGGLPTSLLPEEPTGALPRELPGSPLVEMLPYEESETASYLDTWRRRLLPGTYFEADFLYWAATDPRENGQIFLFQTVSTPPGTITPAGNFSTGQPNTDAEFGVKVMFGHRLNDLLAVEVGGFWVFPFEYPLVQNDAVQINESILPGVTTQTENQVFFSVPTVDERLQLARIMYQIEVHGVESNATMALYNRPKLEVKGIGGFRYIGYHELFSSLMVPYQTTQRIDEVFRTVNSLIGGQLGVQAQYNVCEFVALKGFTKLGAAANFEELKVSGPVPGNGRLTGANNLGTNARTQSNAFVDVGFTVVLQLTPNIDAHLGYSAIWMSDVLRAMDQLDLNPANVGNPTLNLVSESVLVGGFIGGIEVRF